MAGCDHLKELFNAEEPFLNQEYIQHQGFISEKNNIEVELEEAKLDYVKKHMRNWATGFAWIYCPFYCKGEGCEDYVAKQKNFNKELNSIMKEKNVSIEEAEQIYISQLGPSFWKGCVDAMIYMKNKKKDLLQNRLNPSNTRT